MVHLMIANVHSVCCLEAVGLGRRSRCDGQPECQALRFLRRQNIDWLLLRCSHLHVKQRDQAPAAIAVRA